MIYQPIGPVLAVMPWNFPFWQGLRIHPRRTWMAGNVGLLKHAFQCAAMRLAHRADHVASCGIFRQVRFKPLPIGAQTGRQATHYEDRCAHRGRYHADRERGRVGVEVGVSAARQIKKVILELGGSDPFIVMPSANFRTRQCEHSLRVTARTINNYRSILHRGEAAYWVARIDCGRVRSRFCPRRCGRCAWEIPWMRATELGPVSTAGGGGGAATGKWRRQCARERRF